MTIDDDSQPNRPAQSTKPIRRARARRLAAQGLLDADAGADAAATAPARNDPSPSRRGARAEGLAPSRSELRRGALDVLALADLALSLPDGKRRGLALDPMLAEELERAHATRAHGARKRQLQYLAKLLRRDPIAVETLSVAIESTRSDAITHAAREKRIDQWRARLVGGGDAALDALIASYPTIAVERDEWASLIGRVAWERDQGKPPAAARALFRRLRGLIAGIVSADPDDNADDRPR